MMIKPFSLCVILFFSATSLGATVTSSPCMHSVNAGYTCAEVISGFEFSGKTYNLTLVSGSYDDYESEINTPFDNYIDALNAVDWISQQLNAVGEDAYKWKISNTPYASETPWYRVAYGEVFIDGQGPDNTYINNVATNQEDGLWGGYVSPTAQGTWFSGEPWVAFTPTEVPVPTAAWFLGSALIGLVGIKRKK